MTQSNEEPKDVMDFDDDFDLDRDYTPTPIIPKGDYWGNITRTGLNKEANSIDFTCLFEGNGDDVCADGETPVDGISAVFKLWLPKPEDATKYIKSGGMTKRQFKLNAIKEFIDSMGFSANTMQEIKSALENGDWLTDGVKINVQVDTYKGNTRHQINGISLS